MVSKSHRAGLEWTAEAAVPTQYQYLRRISLRLALPLSALLVDAFSSFVDLYFRDAVGFHFFDGIAVAFELERFAYVRDLL
jgi:hypothetical protein